MQARGENKYNNQHNRVEAKPQATAAVLSPMMRFGRCLSTIFGEETFCIKKISVSCLRAWGKRFTIITNPSEKSGASHNLMPAHAKTEKC